MKTVFKFIEFLANVTAPELWTCYDRKALTVLGKVEWYDPWKQYIFSADRSAVFSADCLRDIATFMEGLK